jgi:hypothetical protein|tara:strand:+ start:278 stop:487 length:210 start_codon:yes stop_codon:yes gene_type:complete
MMDFSKQRRDRLDDALSEYLTDDVNTDPRQCYEDMMSSTQEWIDYHKNNMNRWIEFRSLIQGYRDGDIL